MILSRKDVPRLEYPRPQFVRSIWFNLNGEWEFAFDDADEGLRLGWYDGRTSAAANHGSIRVSDQALRHQRQINSRSRLVCPVL